jgi:lipid II:glycine glycyltransferase (peptidoglycan interpeptide bridge formation enzyme)
LQALGAIYSEMAKRKSLSAESDIQVYRATQRDLPVGEKMRVILCRAGGQTVAGALFSALGDTAVDLLRATSDLGVKSYGSYLVQWKVIEYAKQKGCHWYNLNGVDPLTNPGGYQFKSQLGGKHGNDVFFLGPYDSHPNAVTRVLLGAVDKWLASRKRRTCSRTVSTAPRGSFNLNKSALSGRKSSWLTVPVF